IPIAFVNRAAAMGPLFLASCAVLLSVVFRSAMEKAERAEEEGLTEAGAQTYLGFHLQRVNGLLSSDANRKKLMAAADAHKKAITEWKRLAGHIHVDLVLERAA